MECAPPWVVGAILWRARTTPLVNLDALIKGSLHDAEVRSRIVVLNALSDDPKLRNYCILATGVSTLIELERASVDVDDDDDEILRPPGVLRHVRISGESAMIPDLDFIEDTLRDVVLKKSQSGFRAGGEVQASALA
jgi:chemosensory pili system protein ChpC